MTIKQSKTEGYHIFARETARRLRDFRAAKQELSRRLLHPSLEMPVALAVTSAPGEAPEDNLVGVGLGEKVTGGLPTGILALKLFVRYKYPDSHLLARMKLPRQLAGLPTDVEQVGTFRKLKRRAVRRSAGIPNPRLRSRPAQPGCSIGYRAPADGYRMAGTFGAVVHDDAGRLYLLSNNHVLADENRLPLGTPIYQPGLLDGGKPSTDQIAKLARFVPLGTKRPNQVDCALAAALAATLVKSEVLHIGPIRGSTAAQLQMQVHKMGRTTAYTTGRIASVDTDVKVAYDMGSLIFENQIIIVGSGGSPFSASGDSGSLIVERSSQLAVGLLFAGSDSHTIANHLSKVLKSLDVRLA